MSKIQGVIFKNIKSHIDDRGFFREIFKENKLISKKFKQISHSFIKKNIIKAWHLHRKQCQWNYLLKGKIKLYLFDTRNNSKTYKKDTAIFIDSKKKNVMYIFTAGGAQGYITLS